MDVKIRGLSFEDVPAVLAVQHESPGAAQWSESDYRRLAEDPSGLILVAEMPDNIDPSGAGGRPTPDDTPRTTDGTRSAKVVGFAAFHRVLDEAELRNAAVLSRYRRRGVGRALLNQAHRELRQLGVKTVYLEVRAGNVPAIHLYEAAGYLCRSIRKDYYRGPDEGALVMGVALIPLPERC